MISGKPREPRLEQTIKYHDMVISNSSPQLGQNRARFGSATPQEMQYCSRSRQPATVAWASSSTSLFFPLTNSLMPTRRVRDAVGPSPAAARVERCVYITNPLMVRPNGSPASAIARQRGFQLPLLIKMFCNQSCGNKHMDMLNLLLG